MDIAGLIVIILLIVLYFVPIKDSPLPESEYDSWLVSAIITALAVNGVISLAQKEEWMSLSLDGLQKEVEGAFDVNGNWVEFVMQFVEADPLDGKELYGFISHDIDG
ncbi:hypothetical protein E2R51_05345 [Jeotgalibacillus sp. S-D1]|uniref:hypothetical protein n=1 Tax=Jeotgalibacillus sp. S-D1 TaxID=2552189 RepID=UPI0010595911|nr:hypothetical protein [Jeotgalibacillus sp. S-D1]TDL35146.1 hypothetical protein E2R51_05345 [Jeotgalibacillus sp. S-D1]